ncbi:F-box/kelch-repeat protein At1g57790-like [Hibiscus syriacus]|uniref:F-box/kelch-repeat protein At1g57790-like n=1 Tax=Hibiscus syriacus TaxID=106335 RepID=UPI00192217AD|nr:F-box/kelch-repeat protein At1g57790-like [Hibiscus syriacus]
MSTNCVVFSIRHEDPVFVPISICHPGASEWTTANHPSRLPFVSSCWDKPVFSNGAFYCVNFTGWLGIYYHRTQYWKVIAAAPPRFSGYFYDKQWWKGKYLTEHNGDILIIHTVKFENTIVYKLDLSEKNWKAFVVGLFLRVSSHLTQELVSLE